MDKITDTFIDELITFITPVLSEETYSDLSRPITEYEETRQLDYYFNRQDIHVTLTLYMITNGNFHSYEYEDRGTLDEVQYATELRMSIENKPFIYHIIRYIPMTVIDVIQCIKKKRHGCHECGRWMNSMESYCCSCEPFVTAQGTFGTCSICETDREGCWVIISLLHVKHRVHYRCAITHYPVYPYTCRI